jgi:SEC-C motif-containing protein
MRLPNMVRKYQPSPCPCGGGNYVSCCEPFHKGLAFAPTAEVLMKSRYSAYALGLSDYVQATWHVSTRPKQLDLSQEKDQGKWIGLTVKHHKPQATTAEVEFVARYKAKSGPASRLHENSRFVLEGGRWFYVDGDLFDN